MSKSAGARAQEKHDFFMSFIQSVVIFRRYLLIYYYSNRNLVSPTIKCTRTLPMSICVRRRVPLEYENQETTYIYTRYNLYVMSCMNLYTFRHSASSRKRVIFVLCIRETGVANTCKLGTFAYKSLKSYLLCTYMV